MLSDATDLRLTIGLSVPMVLLAPRWSLGREWHETFRAWAKPPSETEEVKASRAADMVRDAVRSSLELRDKTFEVYASGSYRNNTNVKTDSDIDVAVVLTETVYYDLAPGQTAAMVGLVPASYTLDGFRRDVEAALVAKFGAPSVHSGNKAFDIKANTYRLDADVAVFLQHRRYTGRQLADGTWEYVAGVEMRPRSDSQRRIINWHAQHYAEGVARNTATGRRFKRVARILKRLRQDMITSGTQEARQAAEAAPSFLLECLAFNAPDTAYNRAESTYYDDVKEVIARQYRATTADASAAPLVEVNRMKALFGPHQGWTRQQANAFLLRAWHHVGFA